MKSGQCGQTHNQTSYLDSILNLMKSGQEARKRQTIHLQLSSMIYQVWLLNLAALSALALEAQRDFSSLVSRVRDRLVSLDVQQSSLSSPKFSQNCSDGAPAASFEVQSLLSLFGKPSLVSEADIAALEEAFVVAYNELQTCSVLGTSRTLDKATVIYNATSNADTNQSYPTTANSLTIHGFTYLLIAQGRSCNFCGTNATILLFSNVSGSGSQVGTRSLKKFAHMGNDFSIKTHGISQNTGTVLGQSAPTTFAKSEIRNGNFMGSVYEGASKLLFDSNDSYESSAKTAVKISTLDSTGVSSEGHMYAFDRRGLQNSSVCDCQGPVQSSFTTAMSSLLFPTSGQNSTSANVSGINLDAISGITGATQLLPIGSCNPNNRSGFNTTLVLRFTASIAQSLTPSDIETIGHEIQQSYQAVNGLNSQICDPYFRRIVKVQSQFGVNRRRLAGFFPNTTDGRSYNVSYNSSSELNSTGFGNLTYSTGGFVELFYQTQGTCVGCSANTFLFDDVSSRRRLQQQNSTIKTPSISQVLDTTCFCPQGATKRGPSLREFSKVLNTSLSSLTVNASSGFSLLQIVQATLVPCSAQVETFSSTVAVPITVDANITTTAINSLEKCTAMAYNLMAGLYCDPYYRKIYSVQSVLVPVYGASTKVQFDVIAECRGSNCSQNVSFDLFSDSGSVRRHLLEKSKPTIISRRFLQASSDICYCNVNSPSSQAQTTSDFVFGFNACQNSQLSRFFLLPNSTIPSDQPSFEPSDGPSREPSSMPSGSPSRKPSLRPSNEPSSIPSTEPSSASSQPSIEPKRNPSSIPSNKPSSNPSRNPSATPTRDSRSIPSNKPSSKPSVRPSAMPSREASSIPSIKPSSRPSIKSSTMPSKEASSTPSGRPISDGIDPSN